MQQLLDRGVSVNERGEHDMTPLHYAAMEGSLEVIQRLFDHGADLNARESRVGSTPLLISCHFQQVQAAELLLDLGAQVDATGNAQVTPLHIACTSGSMELVRMLLSKNANPFATTKSGWMPIHLVCENGQVPVVQLLLQIPGSDVNAPTTNGWTPLHLAVTRSHLDLIQFLLQQGADITRTIGDELVTALHLASGHYASLRVVQLLLEHGADPMARDVNMMMPIFHACHGNHGAIVETFLDHIRAGDMLVATIGHQLTCLHVTCSAGNLDIARLLLRRGANLEAQSVENQRPLHLACCEGHVDLIRFLLEEGAELEPMDRLFQFTPLGMAAFYNHAGAVRLLLDQGANVVVSRNQNLSVLDVACRVGGLEVAQIVLSRYGIIESETNGQLGPVYEAGSRGQLEMIWMLVKRYPWLLANSHD